MVEFHRLNPNAMLVLLGTAIYAVACGPAVMGGGLLVAVLLGVRNRPRPLGTDDSGPMSLFGPPVGVEDGRRVVFWPFLRPLRVAA